jgi:hypothetical protein
MLKYNITGEKSCVFNKISGTVIFGPTLWLQYSITHVSSYGVPLSR